jgi:iron(III) transport system ATP-binding protein/putative spermidine/putrescine transport system ATP-binding protein/spermidine/putrescine transport system ATP-binding protein
MQTAETAQLRDGDAVDVVIRQEDIRLDAARKINGSYAVAGMHDGRIALRSFVGARVQYVVALADGLELLVETPTNGPLAGFDAGTAVSVSVDPAHVYVSGR